MSNRETKSEEKLSENQLATIVAAKEKEYTSETKTKEKPSGNPEEVVPSTTKYITATGKQALILLQSAAAIIPVPMLKEAIGLALKIIEVCEDISTAEHKVKELQDRVCHLMVVIVDNVTAKSEEGSDEAVMKAAKRIERDIEELLSTLKTINEELDKITAQGPWLLGIYKDLNVSAVDDCLNRLSTALEKFKLANDLRDSDLLQELHARLTKIQSLTQQVANKVDDVHEDVKDIKQILAKTRRSATLRPLNTVFQQMPLKPGIFHGRDHIVEEITQLLMKEETSRICILGPGGMGKTSVSLGVIEQPLIETRFSPENCVWVPCIEATSASLLLEILYIQLQIPGDKHITLERIISELNNSPRPRLILLDNFETPYNAPGGTQKQVEDILRRLARLRHVAILVTMRGRYPPCDESIKWQSKHIRPTDEASCLRIYHDIHPGSEDDPDVNRLLSILGHMPFAVTLMANLAKQGQSTAEELLVAWSKSGPDILPNQHEQSINRSIGLSVDSYLMRQNPQALLLLKTLSFLPAGTTKANLRWWVPALDVSLIPSAIATLFNAGLLVENKQQDSDSPVLFVLPVVQSFMQHHGRIEDEIRNDVQSSCCQYVLDHACREHDFAFPTKSKALAAEDTNIQAILFCSPASATQHINSSNRTIEALIAFSWHRCDTKPNFEIANYTVAAAKASAIKKYIASAVWCLGSSYLVISDYYLASNHLEEAYQLFNTFPPGDRELECLCCQCGHDLITVLCMVYTGGDKVVSLAWDVESKSAALSDDFVYAQSLVALGASLGRAGQYQEALHHVERAAILLKAVGRVLNLSDAYFLAASIHFYENRLSEALESIDEAWKYAEMSSSPFARSHISLQFGAILLSADRDTEAWKYLELALLRASYIGDRRASAITLDYMGYGYLRRGDYTNAYGAYEAAAEKYLGTTNEVPGGTRCKNNMAKIKDRQTNKSDLGSDVGYERPYMDNDDSLFYPPC